MAPVVSSESFQLCVFLGLLANKRNYLQLVVARSHRIRVILNSVQPTL